MPHQCPHCGGPLDLDEVYQQPMDPEPGLASGHQGLYLVGGRPANRTWAQAWDKYDQALADLDGKIKDLAELARMGLG